MDFSNGGVYRVKGGGGGGVEGGDSIFPYYTYIFYKLSMHIDIVRF